ncbi:DUF4013 domain-containing protein [Candidatus Micrarchaeota archaeon]|nr:DUF4013 domain-containing protein [Candidatus Micrarchaeota archaeon]
MVDLVWAIKRPFSDMKKLGIGTILGAIPIVNHLTVPGYSLNCAKGAAGKKALPKWDDYGEIIKKSILFFVARIIYLLPALIVASFVLGAILENVFSTLGNVFSIFTNEGYIGTEEIAPYLIQALGASMNGTLVCSIFVMLILTLLSVFVLPAALTRYALKGKFEEAFKFKAILKRVLTGEYIIAWIEYMIFFLVISLVLGLITMGITFVPIVGEIIALLISGFGYMILYVTKYSIFGQLKY